MAVGADFFGAKRLGKSMPRARRFGGESEHPTQPGTLPELPPKVADAFAGPIRKAVSIMTAALQRCGTWLNITTAFQTGFERAEWGPRSVRYSIIVLGHPKANTMDWSSAEILKN